MEETVGCSPQCTSKVKCMNGGREHDYKHASGYVLRFHTLVEEYVCAFVILCKYDNVVKLRYQVWSWNKTGIRKDYESVESSIARLETTKNRFAFTLVRPICLFNALAEGMSE